MATPKATPTTPTTPTTAAPAAPATPAPAQATTKSKRPVIAVENMGFEIISDDQIPRLVTSSDAQEKTGKTHTIGFMPTPVAVISMDPGTRPTLTRFAIEKPGMYQLKQIRSAKSLKEDEVNIAGCKKVLEELRDTIASVLAACKQGKFRSLAIDTGTDIHELVKMALHGKTTQIMQFAYGGINDLTKEVIAPIIQHDEINAHVIHRVKKEYKGPKAGGADASWTGNHELAGLAEIKYITDIHFGHLFDPEADNGDGTMGAFGLTVGRSRYEPISLNGQTFWRDEARWNHIASLAWPNVDPSWWD